MCCRAGMARKLLVASLVGAAAILALVFGLNKPTVIYSVGVSYFLTHDMSDQRVRLKGKLVHGSLCKVEADCGYRFSIQEWRLPPPPPAEQLSVSYDACVIPDTFREMPGMDVEVRVEGERCQTCHDFAATNISTMCPGKYEMRQTPQPAQLPIPRCKGPAPRT